jgi:hypothetical protein
MAEENISGVAPPPNVTLLPVAAKWLPVPEIPDEDCRLNHRPQA